MKIKKNCEARVDFLDAGSSVCVFFIISSWDAPSYQIFCKKKKVCAHPLTFSALGRTMQCADGFWDARAVLLVFLIISSWDASSFSSFCKKLKYVCASANPLVLLGRPCNARMDFVMRVQFCGCF